MRLPRTDWDTYWMVIAHVAATRATCNRGPKLVFDPERSGTGAVLVRDNVLVATGYNGSPPGQPHCDEVGHEMVDGHCVRTLHAESNALMQCAGSAESARGATCYVTTKPCYKCLKELARAGVKRVLYHFAYRDEDGRADRRAQEFGIEMMQWTCPDGVALQSYTLPVAVVGDVHAQAPDPG